MQTKKTSEHKILPFSFFGAMLCAMLFLDAVLPLEGFWLHTAILPQVGPWSLLPTHLLFPGWAISSSITSSKPTPPSVAISWMQLPLLLAAFLLVFLMYLLAVRRLPHYITSFRYILYSTLLLGIISVLFPVVTSPDIYSYISYARIGVLYHLNPLTTLPTAISTDPVYMNVYWNDQPSAYGPTWAAIASVLQWFTLIFGSQSLLPMVLALRLFGLATHLCSTALIWSIAGRLQHLQGRVSPQKRIVATLAFAWNPLLLLEACVNAHNDAAMLLLVLLAIWFLLPGRLKPFPAFVLAAVMLALATCLKLNTVVLVPLVLIFMWKQQAGTAGMITGRGQAVACGQGEQVAPTMLRRSLASQSVHSRGDGLSSPCARSLVNTLLLGLIYAGIIILLYAPFWQNGAILNIFHTNPTTSRDINSVAEFVSRLYNSISEVFGSPPAPLIGSPAENFTHTLSIGIFFCLYAFFCWKALTTKGTMNTLPSLVRWLALAWLLYCALGAPWFWPWYIVTLLGLSALIESTSSGKELLFGLFRQPLATYLLSFSMLSIYCFYAWGPHDYYIPWLPDFQLAYLHSLWAWGIPLLAIRGLWRLGGSTSRLEAHPHEVHFTL